MNIAIVVIGYKDAYKISRILTSLENADYLGDKVHLYISVDRSETSSAEDVAKEFNWKNGEKTVITHEERLGLKKHILKCGELLNNHDALIVLEDDLMVSKDFYAYASQAVDKYSDDSKIAGISLYSHRWNVNANLPFEPCHGYGDTYFLQFAQSWGQIWLKNTWKEFMEWYDENGNKELSSDYIPQNVKSWPETSWLKYHIAFCVNMDKYFVYPYESFTTCFNEAGQHNKKRNSLYQVQLYEPGQKTYTFADFNSDDAVKYDVFFERLDLGKTIKVQESDLEVDIYGQKPIYKGKKYLITCRSLNFQIMHSWGVDMRPHEVNITRGVEGNQLFMYDLGYTAKAPQTAHDSRWYGYYFRIPTGTKAGVCFGVKLLISRIMERIHKSNK